MRTKTIELYQYAELSDAAKSKARDWYREASAGDTFFADATIEDFIKVAAFCGWTIDMQDASFTSTKTGKRIAKTEPAVYWSLAYCQGDFASFDGSWQASDVNAAGLKEYAPVDTVLHGIAERLAAIAAKQPDATGSVNGRRDYPEFESYPYIGDALGDDWREATRDLTQWLYRTLRAENDYQTSDENVAETIEANEYEFTADGKRCS